MNRADMGSPCGNDPHGHCDRLCRELGQFGGGLIACIEDYGAMGMTDEAYQCIRRAFGSTARGVSRPLPRRERAAAGG